MQAWIKFVAPADIKDGVAYFLAKHMNIGDPYHEYAKLLCRGRNGVVQWGDKPGIAMRFEGGADFVAHLAKDPSYKAVAIPDDAHKRWRARGPAWRKPSAGATGESK